jgi:DNA-binding helix-hairpin-helix protein with protein kinase domain/Tfp pilus assembly protein PilF
MSSISGGSQAEAISPMRRTFYASQSDIVRLGQRIGTGAEGEVYEIQDKSDLVAKIYHEPPPPEKAEKLVLLSRLGNERLFKLSAWPVSTLRDAPEGEVVGFVMKKISQAEEVHALHSPKSRLQKFPEASWAFLIYVAANVARAVAAIHEHGLVIGDVNPKNILVTREATVYLLDVDSFQVSAEGKTYRCESGFPEYTPPELQGIAFRDIDRAQEHDCFGLGVVIFQLLFMGRHPFSGRYLGAGEMPLERAIGEFRFAYGADAEEREMRQPPGTLALDSMPPALLGLFRRAYLSTDRPQAREWVEPLDALAKELKKCESHNGHYYYRELRDCPWCGIESQASVRLFNFLLPEDGSRRGHFRLDDIWKDIVSVTAPKVPPLVQWDEQLAPPTPSAEVAAFARDRRNRLILALVLSTITGLAIPSIANFPGAFLLLIIAGLAACAVGKVERTTTVKLLFQKRQPTYDGVLLEEVEARWLRAEEAARRLQEQFNREAGSERWGAKRDELRNRKETYENLAQIRQFMLQQLEAEARKSQLYEFLDQFSIDDAEIKGVISPIKAALLSHGVETAADVIEEVSQIPSVGRSQAERLLEWRRDLEQGFVFDTARGVSTEARVKTERDVDALRFRLESELSGGAHYLRRVKLEIETVREKLEPALARASQERAHAEKDLEVAGKRNSPTLILAALIIAFFIGWMIYSDNSSQHAPAPKTPRKDSGRPPALATGQVSKPLDEKSEQKRSQEALMYYSLGLKLSGEGKFAKAVKVFQEVIRIDPQFYDAHVELGYALYRLGKYEESISSSQQATSIRSAFIPYYNMGLAYIAQKDWSGATYAFERAITHCNQTYWEERYSYAYYYWGLSLARLGKAETAIEDLEKSLETAPEMPYERFELATLYLGSGKHKEAMAQYRILRGDDPMLANELLKLIKKYRKLA